MARIFTRREVQRRRMTYQVFAGMFDFLGILAGVLVIIACVVLLSSLIRWALADGEASFRTLWDIFISAIIVPQ